MKKILSWKNLLVILLASAFLGAGFRTSKDINFLYWANFIDIFSGFVFLLLIIAIVREVIKKYRKKNGVEKLTQYKVNKDSEILSSEKPSVSENEKQIKVTIKKFLKENWFKIIIALVILLIAFSLFYYLFIFIPKIEKEKEREKLLKEAISNQCQLTCVDTFGSLLDYFVRPGEEPPPKRFYYETGGTKKSFETLNQCVDYCVAIKGLQKLPLRKR